MQGAQQNLLLALQMRSDGIANIATGDPARARDLANKDAINSIATQMARFYASDVVYKDYTTHADRRGPAFAAGITRRRRQRRDDQRRTVPPRASTGCTPTFVHIPARRRTCPRPASGKIAPGLHGHSLDSVSVGGNTLQTGLDQHDRGEPGRQPSRFHFTNGGTNNETNVVLKVTVQRHRTSSGQKVVPQTTAGQSTTCQVTLKPAPPSGQLHGPATVEPVPGEKNTANNTLTFPVSFQ